MQDGGRDLVFGATHRALLDQLADAVVVAGTGNTVIYLNAAAAQLFGRPAEDAVGLPLIELMPARFRSDHLAGFHRYLESGQSRIIGTPVRVPALRADGVEVPVELTLSTYEAGSGPLFMAVIRDLTERIELERAAAQAGSLRAVSQAAALLGDPQATSIEDVAGSLLEAVTASLGWQAAALWLTDETGDGLVCVEVYDPDGPDDEWTQMCRARTFRRGEGLPGRVWGSAEPVWITDVLDDSNYPRVAAARRRGLQAAMAFPVISGDRTLGALEMYAPDALPPDADLLDAVATVGHHLGLFLERARILSELQEQKTDAEVGRRSAAELARTLQASLLPPSLPAIPHLDVADRYESGSANLLVGGDFYDLFALPGGGWGVVIGDIQGKGAKAAVATGVARYTIRAVAAHPHEPEDPLRELNHALHRHAAERPRLDVWEGVGCTACYLRVWPDADRTRLDVACGGHPPPLVLRATGVVEAVECTGTVLGLLDDDDFEIQGGQLELAPGDALILFTDGVVEARHEGALFGLGGLGDALVDLAGASARELADGVVNAVIDFTDGHLRDDLAVVVLRMSPRPAA